MVGGNDRDKTKRRFDTAIERMRRHARTSAHAIGMEGHAAWLGHVGLEMTGPASRAALEPGAAHHSVEPQRLAAAFHGALYNGSALRRDLQLPADASVEMLIAALYTREGAAFVDRLEGEYCLAVVDAARGDCVIATDPIGNYPLYWRADPDGFIFSSDLSALIKATPAVSRLDLSAVADYVTIGAVFGRKTLADGVQLLEPGTVLTYHTHRGELSERQYVRLETFFYDKVSDKSRYFDELVDAFAKAVARATCTSDTVGLSLSGGLDSRAILAATHGNATRPRTYTLGVEGCADQVIAERLSAIAQTPHSFFRLDESYLKDFLPNMAQMVSITDGMYLSHGLTEMLAIQFLELTGIEVLLRGHGGELAKAHLAWPLHTDAHIYGLKSIDELVDYLSARANYVTPGFAVERLLTPEAASAAGRGSRDSFAKALTGTGLSPADACSYLYLRELNRRFTVPSLELFRTRVEVRLPYLDPAFLRVLLRGRTEWRDTTEIHQALTRSGDPRLLKVRNSNTGAAADAGPQEEFVLDKVNTIFKRLGVRGYRHYHDFDRWMRRMLLESVEAELLSPGARVQSFVAKSTLHSMIQDTRQGAADHSYFLQILLILELWQRDNHIQAAA